MENCEILKKSVLKKSNLSVMKKGKRVTFCSTVKVFIDELHSHPENFVDLQLNCVEVNIVDKSSDDSPNTVDISKNDDCNATDFFVHKVIYDRGIEHDDGTDADAVNEEAEEGTVLFETNTEDEGLQFVVHKVTDHEDDLIQQELDLADNDVNSDFHDDSEIIGKLSQLSLENILAHDKIIAYIDENTIGLSSFLKSHIKLSENSFPHINDSSEDNVKASTITTCVKSSELILSPPLQELSLDKIVKAQSGNILCELDISPLNSILETDSDSDLSSEGTMIMMTTEESEKNEQHIRESFLKYESMKKEKVQVNDPDIATETKENSQNVPEMFSENVHSDSASEITLKKNPSNILYVNFKEGLGERTCVNEVESAYSGSSDSLESVLKEKVIDDYITASEEGYYVSSNHEGRKIPFAPINNSCHWDHSLASIQIPKDVREWKIHSSPEKDSKSDSKVGFPNLTSVVTGENVSVKTDLNDMQENSKSDELESFVLASKERVQRIRKRYLDKTHRKMGGSPVRGIRPRFGSTAEILQLVQKQNHHPLITYSHRSHVSWPCNDAISNTEVSIQNRRQLNHIFGCQSLPSGSSSLNSSISDDLSSNCDHDSVSSCPSIFFLERGVPEGASPPQSLSEDSIESCINEDSSNIVYFSMKV